MDTIGQRIKVLREMRGISQSELSRRISVTPQAIQSLEADSNPNRKTKHVVGIAAVLDVDPRYLDLQTSYDQFQQRIEKQARDSRQPAAIDSANNANDDALIDAAIEQARNNVNLQLKLSGGTISGREYLERLSDELRRLTE
ncbi:MAG: helix-turn-helix transcriptional regulator [Rhizobiaceae bacterium]